MKRKGFGGAGKSESESGPFRFVLDARPLGMSSRYQGTGVYCRNLSRHLLSIDKRNTYLLLQRKGRPCREKEFPLNFKPHPVRRGYDQDQRFGPLLDPFLTPVDLFRARADLYHAVSVHYACWRIACPLIVTLYDMIPLIYPEAYIQTGFKHRLLYRLARSADHILAPSESTKRDVHGFLGIPLERITVTPFAVDERFRPVDEEDRVKSVLRKYGISQPFLLYVGGFTKKDPRRDLIRLVDIFHELRKAGFEDHSLVLAGSPGQYSEMLAQEMRRTGREGGVVFAGPLEQEDLPLLYNGARCFVFPSLYEGFGFTPLEAISCGVPTIAYDNSSMPEVLGDAGILVEEKNPRAFFDAIRSVLTRDDLAETLRAKGLSQAKKFGWEKTARMTLDVYKAAVAEGMGRGRFRLRE